VIKLVVNKYNLSGFIATYILALPFFIYAHLLFSPSNSGYGIFNFSFSEWLNDNETFVWTLLNDLVPLNLLLLMFFTTRKMWKLFLLPLLIFYCSSILLILDFFSTIEESTFSFEAILISIILVFSILIFDRYIAEYFRHRSMYVNLQFLLSREYKINLKLIRSKLKSLHSEKYKLSLRHYLKKLFYLHLILEKKLENNYSSNNKIKSKNKKGVDLVLVLLIIIITFIWYLPYIIPKETMQWNILNFTFDSNGFNDIRTFLWFITRKLVVVIFLSIWFITSEHWWKYAIFSPLIIFSYQFWEAFQDVKVLEATGNLKVFPLVLLNILLVAGISKWVKYRTDLLLIYDVICKEVEDLMEELKGEHLDEIAVKYKEIKEGYQGKDVDYYKTKLKALEQELLLKLNMMQG